MSTPALAMRQPIVRAAPTNKWLVTISITFCRMAASVFAAARSTPPGIQSTRAWQLR